MIAEDFKALQKCVRPVSSLMKRYMLLKKVFNSNISHKIHLTYNDIYPLKSNMSHWYPIQYM